MRSRFAALAATAVLFGCTDTSAPTLDPAASPSLVQGPTLPLLTTVREVRGGAGANGNFNITIRYANTPTAVQRAAFDSAVAKWQRIITGDVPSTTGRIRRNFCTTGTPVFNGTIDDILIDAVLTSIDGPGNILGSAGPCLVRTSDRLTSYGIMKFDTADLANLEASGLLDEVIVHEMGHVLGVGSLWNYQRTLRTGPASNPVFVGAQAVGQYALLGGSGNVPVENTGGSGTANSHWRETTFSNELMTGFLNSGVANPLSNMSAASMFDLGYVGVLLGDPYSLPGGAAILGRRFDIGNRETVLAPIARVE